MNNSIHDETVSASRVEAVALLKDKNLHKNEAYLLELPIENGVPIPRAKRGTGGKKSKTRKRSPLTTLIMSLEIGQSVVIPLNAQRVRGSLSRIRPKSGRGFESRVLSTNQIRVWRTS